MCRNIRVQFNVEPPTTDDEVRAPADVAAAAERYARHPDVDRVA
jgi:hypothetical protein